MSYVHWLQAHAKEWFRYDPATGFLYWIKSSRGHRAGKRAGHTAADGRTETNFLGTKYRNSRLVWIWHHGIIPPGMLVDHINHDPQDNRIENLRLVTPAQNHKNRKLSPKNKTGHAGVNWDKRRSKWFAVITVDYKVHFLGYFSDIERAIEARREAQRHFGFHPNHGAV